MTKHRGRFPPAAPGSAAMKRALNAYDKFRAGAVGVEPQFQQPVKAKRVPKLLEPPGPSEHKIQAAVIDFWRHACKGYGLPEFALFACPSGGARDVITGSLLKAEGARRGVPDLILAVPRGKHHGAFIEMKRPGGRTSQEQVEFMRYLEGAGYRCAVCWSTEAAIREMKAYLALEPGMAMAHQMGLPA